jgi:hypothetical protein
MSLEDCRPHRFLGVNPSLPTFYLSLGENTMSIIPKIIINKKNKLYFIISNKEDYYKLEKEKTLNFIKDFLNG